MYTKHDVEVSLLVLVCCSNTYNPYSCWLFPEHEFSWTLHMWASRDGSRNTCRYTVTHVDTHRNSLPVCAGLMCTCVAALRNYVTATELKSSTTAVPTVQYSTVQCKSVPVRGIVDSIHLVLFTGIFCYLRI